MPISENQVDLYLKVEEKSTDQANVSAGYSQRDKFIGSVGFQMNNLLGNGQQLSLDWNFGQYYQSFSVSFTEPWFRNTRTLVGASFYDTYRRGTTYGFDETVLGGTLRVGRRLRWPDDYFRLDYIYRLDRTVYSNFTADVPPGQPAQSARRPGDGVLEYRADHLARQPQRPGIPLARFGELSAHGTRGRAAGRR